MTTRNGDEESVKLGWRGSFCFGCGVGVVVLLVIGLIIVWKGREAERRRVSQTKVAMGLLWLAVTQDRVPPPADGSGADWTGQAAVSSSSSSLVLDGWGNPLRYRKPGPVHTRGFDIWSCGPNGKDDRGTFDDILIGEDVASVRS